MEAEFFHHFEGEEISKGVKVYGKSNVIVEYEPDDNKIINIFVEFSKVDFNLPYTKGNIIDVSKRYLEDL